MRHGLLAASNGDDNLDQSHSMPLNTGKPFVYLAGKSICQQEILEITHLCPLAVLWL